MEIIEEGKVDFDYLKLLVWRFNTFFIKYNNIKKFSNFCVIKLQKKLRKLNVSGYPYELLIESSSICNLKCPNCLSHSKDYHHSFLDFSKFKKIIDLYKDYVYNVELFSWGEPFLNPKIYKMIRYAKRNGLFVRISSNFNSITKKDINEIIDSKLDFLKLSIDGASQKTYKVYRSGGDFEKVMRNIRELIEKKRKLKKKHPLIEWQFIVNRYNEHEMDKAKELAIKIGIDRLRFFNFSPIHINAENNPKKAERWLPKNKRYRLWEDCVKPNGYVFNTNCCYLWQSLTISSKGKVSLCPNRIGSMVDCGEFNEESFWNKEDFTKARGLFKETSIKESIPCSKCREFRQK